MKSIGPYVVLREVVVGEGRGAAPAAGESAPRRSTARTLWAADRLTGLPVLLHPLSAIAPAPRLPAHPRLLPFTDMVVEMAGAYLATELPPQTRPARDPTQAARGALEALTFLHSQGLAHGSLDAAQLWEVDGEVRVTGAGLPRPGLRPQPLDDLRDLIAALETMDAPPGLLAALRGAPDLASAQEFLDLLDMGLSEQQLAGALAHVPALKAAQEPPPAIFDSPDDIVLGGALADDVMGTPLAVEAMEQETASVQVLPEREAEAPVTPAALPQEVLLPAEEQPTQEVAAEVVVIAAQPSTPEMGEMQRRPASDTGTEAALPTALFGGMSEPSPAEAAPAVETESPASELAAPARPRAVRRAAGRQARDRLKADHRRRLDLSELRLRRTAAEVEQLQTPAGAQSTVSVAVPPASAEEHSGASPQERRRLEQQAWEEQVALDAQLAAARRAQTPRERPASVLVPGAALGGELAEIAEVQRRPRQRPAARAQGMVRAARQLAPIRMGWGRDGERQVLRQRGPREELLRWLLPTLGVLLLAFAVSTVPRALRSAAPAPCCDVAFQLLGAGAEQRADLTLLSAPPAAGWQRGARLGQAPGTLHLPAPGTYRIKVSAAGYAPARVDVTAPRHEPVTVQLGH